MIPLLLLLPYLLLLPPSFSPYLTYVGFVLFFSRLVFASHYTVGWSIGVFPAHFEKTLLDWVELEGLHTMYIWVSRVSRVSIFGSIITSRHQTTMFHSSPRRCIIPASLIDIESIGGRCTINRLGWEWTTMSMHINPQLGPILFYFFATFRASASRLVM